MEVLPAGLWSDLIFVWLQVSEVLGFRLCSKGCNRLVTQQIPRLISVHSQSQATLLESEEIRLIKEGQKSLCELLTRSSIYPTLLQQLSNLHMVSGPVASVRFLFMNLMAQTHNPSHLERFGDQLMAQDFACFQSKESLGKTLKVVGQLLSYPRTAVELAFKPELYEFIESLADLAIDVPEGYYLKRTQLERLNNDIRVLSKLCSRH